MARGICPECNAEVHIDLDAEKGDMVSCEECGSNLEIVGLDPVELDLAEDEAMTDDSNDKEEF